VGEDVTSKGGRRAPAAVPPFRARGLLYQGARDFYDAVIPGGFATVTASITDIALRSFCAQSFVAGGLYDVMPIIPLATAAARVRGVTFPSQVRDNARWLAERDLNRVFRALVSLATPEMLALRLPRISMRYFDFGRADGKMTRDKLLESHRIGVPASLAQWFVLVTEGFVPYALGLTGAKNVRVRTGPPRPDGAEHGVPVVRLRFEISWE
jgi:hypothetical protein